MTRHLHVRGNITVHGTLYNDKLGAPFPEGFRREYVNHDDEPSGPERPSEPGLVQQPRLVDSIQYALKDNFFKQMKKVNAYPTIARPGNVDTTYCKYASTIQSVLCYGVDFFHIYDMNALNWQSGMNTLNRPSLNNAMVELIPLGKAEFLYVSHGLINYTIEYNVNTYRIPVDALKIDNNARWEQFNYPSNERPSERQLSMHIFDPVQRFWVWYSGQGANSGLSDFWIFDPYTNRWLVNRTRDIAFSSHFGGTAFYYQDTMFMYGGREDHRDELGNFVVNEDVLKSLDYSDPEAVPMLTNLGTMGLNTYGWNPIIYQPRDSRRQIGFYYAAFGSGNTMGSIFRRHNGVQSSNVEVDFGSGVGDASQTSGCMVGDYTGWYFDGTSGEVWLLGF